MERVLHYEPDVPMITSTHSSCNSGGVNIEEGPHVADALVIESVFDHRKVLV